MKRSMGAETLIFPTPTWAVATYDAEEKPNVMTVAWGGICCSKPPCVAVSLRKATYSYSNIVDRKAFTVNVGSERYVKQMDFFGMASGRNTDKLKVAGLAPVKSELVNAPYIKEFPMVIECNLLDSIEIGIHTQFIGEIVDVKVDEEALNDDGVPDIEKIRPVIFAPKAQTYHALGSGLGKGFSLGKDLL